MPTPAATPRPSRFPNILIVRPDGPLFYANAQSVHDGIETLVSSSSQPVHTVIVDLDANDELDITSSEQLDKLIQALHAQSIRVGLAHLHGPARYMARRSGVLDQVGAAHIFPTVAAAVAWARSGAGTGRPTQPDKPRRPRMPAPGLTADRPSADDLGVRRPRRCSRVEGIRRDRRYQRGRAAAQGLSPAHCRRGGCGAARG